jgi:hypothetical protein
VFDEEQTHTANESVERFVVVWRGVKSRSVHVFLPRGAVCTPQRSNGCWFRSCTVQVQISHRSI